MKTRGQHALDIAEDALYKHKMRLARIMHIQADLLNNIGEIRLSQSKILQSTSKTSTLGWICNRRLICSANLGLTIHWR